MEVSMSPHKAMAEENCVLRGVVGSTSHGTGLDGHEDRDEMGVFIETPEWALGLRHIEHYISRTQPEGVPSGPGDLDLTMYTLRKFCRLASKGNPSILLLLYLNEYMVQKPVGHALIALRDAFISGDAGERYLGYLKSQKEGLLGNKSRKIARPELLKKFGFDTKYAMHALRLGYQGIELLTMRRISVPVQEPLREHLRAVRRGEVAYADVLKELDDVEALLSVETAKAKARNDVADTHRIDLFLKAAHFTHWGI